MDTNTTKPPRTDATDNRTPLRFRRLALTGTFVTLSRNEVRAQIERLGGTTVSSVSRRTSDLVIGAGGWPLQPDGGVSHAVRRAEALNRSGPRIRILSESAFRELVGLERAELVRKPLSARKICQVLGVSAEQLKRWEQLSLIHARGGRYDFQDIVSLRTVTELVRAGVRPAVIHRSLEGLARLLPGTERPLAQLRIIAQSPDSLVAEVGEVLVAPDGQLSLDFDAAAGPESAPTILEPELDAQGWFARGKQLEDEERWEEALEAYRRGVFRQPHFPEALFNMGNVERARGNWQTAIDLYRGAATMDESFAEAWYNIADVLEEQDRAEEAISALERAIDIRPAYADAHFNLAMLFEELGRLEEATPHWRVYLKLDAESDWSLLARTRLHERP